MYKITIEHTCVETKTIGKEWARSGQIEKISKPSMYDNTDKKPEPYLSDTYDYTPNVESSETITRIVYEQTVQELDLPSVVGIINNIYEPHEK